MGLQNSLKLSEFVIGILVILLIGMMVYPVGAIEWTTPETIVESVPLWSGNAPSAVFDTSGEWHLVYDWIDWNEVGFNTYHNSLGEQYNFDFNAYPRITIDPSGSLVVLKAGESDSLVIMKLINGQWTESDTITRPHPSYSYYGQPAPSVVFNANGDWHIIYDWMDETETTHITYQNSHGDQYDILTGASWYMDPIMAIDPSGSPAVTVRGAGGSIVMTKLINGQWTSPETIGSGPYISGPASFVYDTSGTWHMVAEGIYRNSLGEQDPLPEGFLHTIAIGPAGNLLVAYRIGGGGIRKIESKPGADLWISEVKPVQVVWDSDINGDGKIDLVSEKPTVIVANITVENADALDQNAEILVRFIYDGQIIDTKSKTSEEIKQNKLFNFTFIPTTEGEHEILVIVDPLNEIQESNDNNNTYSQKVTVKSVNDLNVRYFPITNPKSPYSTKISPIVLIDYQQTAENNNKFVQATFPLGVNDFYSSITSDKQIPAHWPVIEDSDHFNKSVFDDANTVKALGLKTGFAAGIVPDDYFAAHEGDWVVVDGVTYPAIPNTVLSGVGNYATVAHELAHTLKMRIDLEEYDKVLNPSPTDPTVILGGDAANGYDVMDLYNQGVDNRYVWHGVSNDNPFTANGVCFMGNSGGKNTYYWVNSNNLNEKLPRWICKEDYFGLFKALRTNKNDPELLFISGTFSEDGTFSLDNTYWIDSGIPDDMESGDYSIVLLDKNNQMISTTAFPDPYAAIIEPYGRVTMNTGGLAFTIPYPMEVATIQVTHSGEVISEFNPHEQLLDDAISTLPDSAFSIDPTQQRTELQTDISEINTLIEQNNILGARNKLEQVKVKLQDWLIDGYQTENPLQLTKTEVIALIDNILSRLVVITPPNNAPDLQNPGDQTITEGKTLTLNLVATDPDNDPLTYTFTPTLAGASITANTFSWTPITGSAGKYPVTFNVTDTGGLSDEEKINITVTAPTTNVPTTVKIVPKTINLGSKGYFLAFATLPEAYKGATIDMKTVTCSGATAVRMVRPKIFPRIAVFVFKTSDLIDVPLGTKVPLTLNGEMKNTGKSYTFTGSDIIKVISKPTWQPDDIKDISKLTDDQLFKKYSI